MSKFFATLSDSSSEDEAPIVAEKKKEASVLLREDDTDTKRIVQTAAAKQKKELDALINQINNQKKIHDCTNLFHTFGELVRVFEKNGEDIRNHAFFACLASVENFVCDVWKDTKYRQNMTKTASKSLVALRQKVRKYVKAYAAEIADAHMYTPVAEVTKTSVKEITVEENNDAAQVESKGSSDEEWGSSDDESDEEMDSTLYAREYFLKTHSSNVEKNDKSERKRIRKSDCPRKPEEKGWQTISCVGFSAEYQVFLKEELTVASVLKILAVLTGAKNKKLSSNRQKVKLLSELLNLIEAKNLPLPLVTKVRLSLATATLDCNLNHFSGMKPDHWEQTLKYMSTMADCLEDVDFDIDPQTEEEEFEKRPFVVRGCIVSLIERLDEEFFKLLKDCDPHGDEYINHLRDEVVVTDIVSKVLNYVHRHGTDSSRCRINLCKIGHMYYKLDPSIPDGFAAEGSSISEMDRLCKFVYNKDSSHVLRTRAILAQTFHLALHDRWIEARDLMLMSHLQESIDRSDPRTQIMLNRATTMLGFCAFRKGLITDAHTCLSDLVTSGRVKELLGQGFQPFRSTERTREQELRERQYQMPFHMHIALELIDFVYLVSAMIIDVPYLTAFDHRRRVISKPLYQMLRVVDKQCLVGPPENLREHIAAACKSLRVGNWQACYDLLVNPKMTIKVWDKMQNSLQVQKKLQEKIKGAALLAYVMSFAHFYDTLSMDHLADMLAMEPSAVRQQLASIIFEGELSAALDEPMGALVQQNSRFTFINCLAHQLVEKLNLLMDTNERYNRIGQKSTPADSKFLSY